MESMEQSGLDQVWRCLFQTNLSNAPSESKYAIHSELHPLLILNNHCNLCFISIFYTHQIYIDHTVDTFINYNAHFINYILKCQYVHNMYFTLR